MHLDGVALVTGASRGIGAATAVAFAEAGAAVVLAARDEAAITALAERITAGGGRALAVPTDVGDAAAVDRLVARTLDEYGRLDHAVNNAAGGHRPTPLAEVPVEDFDAEVAVSLRGVFVSMRAEIPAMLAGGGGSIVNMASTAALHPVAGLAGYAATKAGVVGLTRTAALDYAASGIRVNALAPGPVHTEQLDRAGPAALERVAAGVPVHRLAAPAEIGAAAVWLCGPAAGFVTGITLPVDGGLVAGMPPFDRGKVG